METSKYVRKENYVHQLEVIYSTQLTLDTNEVNYFHARDSSNKVVTVVRVNVSGENYFAKDLHCNLMKPINGTANDRNAFVMYIKKLFLKNNL